MYGQSVQQFNSEAFSAPQKSNELYMGIETMDQMTMLYNQDMLKVKSTLIVSGLQNVCLNCFFCVFYRILCGSHYDTLKLPRDCTTKDIRDSFIRLSKQVRLALCSKHNVSF
jgi:hypothetical protein